MRTRSLAVTFCETLEVYLREYSRRHKSYTICFRVPTLALLDLLLRLKAISADDAAAYRVFVDAKLPFVIVLHPRTHECTLKIVREARWHKMTDASVWYHGRHIDHRD